MFYSHLGDDSNQAESGVPRLFPHLCAVLRDLDLERTLNLELVSPPTEHIAQLRGLLDCIIQGKWNRSFNNIRVLGTPLTIDQRAVIDRTLEVRYAAAIEKDESPREAFAYTECGERMVDLRSMMTQHGAAVLWSTRPFDPACGPRYGGQPRLFWARASVAERFLAAVRTYNRVGIIPQIEDAFRPYAVQEGLFKRRYKMIREQHPGASAEELWTATIAKTAAAPYRAAHMGGAAIDLTLWRPQHGELGKPVIPEKIGQPIALELGNVYPTGGAATVLHFPYLTWSEFVTRCIFQVVAEMSGLSVYRGEDWHVSAGDAQAALLTGAETVRYCAIQDFDPTSGAVTPFAHAELKRSFTPE